MTHVLDLAEGLIKEKFQPEILFFTEGPSIEEARKRKIPAHLLIKKGIGLVFLWQFVKYLRGRHFDVLHTHTINGNFFGRIAGKLSGVPVLLTTVHSHIIDELKGLREPSIGDHIRYRIDLFFSRWNKALIVVSETIKDILVLHGIPSNKIHTIENGVDIKKFRQISTPVNNLNLKKELGIPEGVKVIGIIGRLVPLKNHEIFLYAAKEVANKRKDVCFLVAGDGPLRDRLRELTEKLGLVDRVILAGWRTDIERVMPLIDILVLCSQVEGHNIVILEAMACGKPVIGTDVRGIRSTVKNGENGLLVPAGDSVALEKAMLNLLEKPSEAEAMGRTGRRYIEERYSVDRMMADYLKLYQEMRAA